MSRWITELDSKDFKVREDAVKSLEALEDLAESALRNALERQPSAEMRRSIGQLLEKLKGPVTSPQRLQALRTIELLEQICTNQAREILEGLAKGSPQARVTSEAKASLERQRRKASSTP